MLTETFGRAYLENGRFRTKYIKPTFVGKPLRVVAQVVSRDDRNNKSTTSNSRFGRRTRKA